ncbi:hypothetical protein Drorol1_Dr00008896 [Drosera rotundifolia]
MFFLRWCMTMKSLKLLQLLSFSLCLIAFRNVVVEGLRNDIRDPVKLFAFGDSYADTGNTPRPTSKTASSSWKVPYGITFPGKPSGRFSDGFVLTDFLAKYLRLKTPVTYKSWKNHGRNRLKYGMNFAYGGSGVFQTLLPYPNMTEQIDFFQQLVKHHVFTSHDIQNAVVLVQLSGNDYSYYASEHPNLAGIQAYAENVVAQLVKNIERVYSFGVKQILVSNIEPLGCLPGSTGSLNYTECSASGNSLAVFHNSLLEQAVAKLNSETKGNYPRIILLDIFDSFLSIINNKTGLPSGDFNFGNPLEPCCIGVNSSYFCASTSEDGEKLYTLCGNRKARFFWDTNHPTQEGWRVVTTLLRATFSKIRI